MKTIKSALISVYNKDGLEPIVNLLNAHGVQIYSTGGTQKFIEGLGIPVTSVESLTSFPEMLGGRVKTLHPKVFGGILARRENHDDLEQLAKHNIPTIDLALIDLYPFEKEREKKDATHQDIIEKIDVGGPSMLRAAAKNYKDVVVVSSQAQYKHVLHLLTKNACQTSEEDRLIFAEFAFSVTAYYDNAIKDYFNQKVHELESA
jgi:phosphoribosylaminoimidazolecarboxamide formyltransferase / IMP cyclohydrolase